MESGQQAKSVEKNSSHGSDGRKRERPSLFPIRNSARRKSSMSENKSIFDPHDTDCNSNRLPKKNQQSDTQDNRETRSEAEFEYRTPSGVSEYSSPRSSKSSPKTFIADTPFVPFVHQSLTKTVWQSEDIIPQQRDDMDRKQSQTQMPKNNFLDNPIKQQRQNQARIQNREQRSDQLYPSLPNLDLNFCQNNKEIKVQENQNFQTYLSLSISVPPQENNALDVPSYVTQQNQSKSEEYITSSYILKQEVEDTPAQITYEVQNQVEHHQYVSKADIIQRQEMQKMVQSPHSSPSQHQHIEPIRQYRPLSFSYIELISIRPIYKPVSSCQQQTSSKILSHGTPCQISIVAVNKSETGIQSSARNLQMEAQPHFSTKSTPKEATNTQTPSYKQKLSLISKSYEQKIGIVKKYLVTAQQTQIIKLNHNATQTSKNQSPNFKIQEEVNLSFNYNYGNRSDQKLEKLEKFIQDIYTKKQNQIQQLRNRKSIEISVNTQEHEQNSSIRTSEKIRVKTTKDTGCQYDQKDIGTGRPSLKRVSIAAAPIIHEIIEDSNSTQTFEQQHQQKPQSKQKSKQKSKAKEKEKEKERQKEKEKESSRNGKKVKLENREQQTQQYTPQQEEAVLEQVKKSKRKASKTPRKKGRY